MRLWRGKANKQEALHYYQLSAEKGYKPAKKILVQLGHTIEKSDRKLMAGLTRYGVHAKGKTTPAHSARSEPGSAPKILLQGKRAPTS